MMGINMVGPGRRSRPQQRVSRLPKQETESTGVRGLGSGVNHWCLVMIHETAIRYPISMRDESDLATICLRLPAALHV